MGGECLTLIRLDSLHATMLCSGMTIKLGAAYTVKLYGWRWELESIKLRFGHKTTVPLKVLGRFDLLATVVFRFGRLRLYVGSGILVAL